VPVYSFSETHYLADSFVTPAYRGTLFALTGKVNSAAFKGCAAGECLFLGAAGSKRGADDWEIAYRFAASPNRTNIVIGEITVASKKGWEYLWARLQTAMHCRLETWSATPTPRTEAPIAIDRDWRPLAAAKAIVKRPVAAYVEKVYEEGNFAGLGIGT